MKKFLLAFLSVLLIAGLCGCSLIPEEETYETSPVIKKVDPVSYKFAYAQRGELTRSENLSCTYIPVRTDTYSFGIGGVLIDEVYVEKGDYVTEGTVLAVLEMGDYPAMIEQSKLRIQKTELSIKHAMENIESDIERYQLHLATLTPEQQLEAESVQEKREELERSLRALEENLTVEQMMLEEYEGEVERRTIRAAFDGTVTYVKTVKTGDVSVESDRFIKLSDTTLNVFSCETKNYELLPPGTYVTITSSKVEYESVVASPEELGIEEPEYEEDDKHTVYFRLLQPAVELEGGDRGTMTLVLEHKDDALYIPTKALYEVDGKPAVYRTDEYGLKSIVYVETGMQADKNIEIISGLENGDAVITQ